MNFFLLSIAALYTFENKNLRGRYCLKKKKILYGTQYCILNILKIKNQRTSMKVFTNTKGLFEIVVLRDVNERGRDLDQILYQYTTFVKPAFEEFCLPVSKLLSFLKLTKNK